MPNFNGQGPVWGGGPGAGRGRGFCGTGSGFGFFDQRQGFRFGRGLGSRLGYRQPTESEVKEDLTDYEKMLEQELAIVKEQKNNL